MENLFFFFGGEDMNVNVRLSTHNIHLYSIAVHAITHLQITTAYEH